MNVERLVRKQDFYSDRSGTDFRDGFMLGNGDLCALASVPAHLEYVFNKVDVFDPTTEEVLLDKIMPHKEFLKKISSMEPKNTLFLEEEENCPHWGKRHKDTISAAVLKFRFWRGCGWNAPGIPLVTRHLSLYDGLLEENVRYHDLHADIEMLIPRETALCCMRVTEKDHPERSHVLELVRPQNILLDDVKWYKKEENILAFSQKLPGKKYSYAFAMKVCPRNGGSPAKISGTLFTGTEMVQQGDFDLFISVKSSLHEKDPLAAVLAEVGNGAEKGYEYWRESNRQFWHSYWDNAYADFGKYKEIQKYYTFSLYEIACIYGKPPMPGLNGMSYGPLDERNAGLSSQGYTHDQNAQIPALAFFPSNRVGFIEVLADTYLAGLKELKRHTKKLFDCDGVFLPLTTNQLMREYPTRSYRYSLCGSAYTGTVLAMAWQYSRDEKLLREKLYPLLREFAIFYQSIFHKGGDGIYHLDWSVTPEIFTLTRDEAAATSLFKNVLKTVIEAAHLLKKDKKYLPLWQDLLENYPPVPKTPSGAFWCGPDVPYDHYFFGGHILYPAFPAEICDDTNALKKTIELIENDAVERSFADYNGKFHMNHDWSAFLVTEAYLRAGEQKKGWESLLRFLELFAKENGLFAHNPILIGDIGETEKNERNNIKRIERGRRDCRGKILLYSDPGTPHPPCVTPNKDAKRMAPAVQEGNSAFLFLASEVLLQSHGGILRLFPGVPDDFTGSFQCFLAQGGFEVSARMKKGKITVIKIRALAGGTVEVSGRGMERFSLTLRKGECYFYRSQT
ncbi:MAG: hypothetical protein IKA79_09020 [Lentisphaeria bacterium]|nr:hypothetical protein [Lentisphaeria bacterium]